MPEKECDKSNSLWLNLTKVNGYLENVLPYVDTAHSSPTIEELRDKDFGDSS